MSNKNSISASYFIIYVVIFLYLYKPLYSFFASKEINI